MFQYDSYHKRKRELKFKLVNLAKNLSHTVLIFKNFVYKLRIAELLWIRFFSNI